MRAFKMPDGRMVVTLRQIQHALAGIGVKVSIQAIRYHIRPGKFFDGHAWLEAAGTGSFDSHKMWIVEVTHAEMFVRTYKPHYIRGRRPSDNY